MGRVILQKIVYPDSNICSDETLYIRKIGVPLSEVRSDGSLPLHFREKVAFDTYYNSFSLLKWVTYTHVGNVVLSIEAKGRIKVNLVHMFLENGGRLKYNIINSEEIYSQERRTFTFDYITENPFGSLSFSIECLEEGSVFYSAAYCSDIEDEFIKDVNLGIGICTFKREEYVQNNIKNLTKAILENQESGLNNKLNIIISDNAGTLKPFDHPNIILVKNKNAGGSGGFTRCMIEAIKYNETRKEKLTHLIMMDDDVKFDPTSIERVFSVLRIVKDQYKDAFIGGAMFKMQAPNIQHASGEYWHGERCESFVETYNNNRNMDEIKDFLENENFTNANYQAWWFCAIPMKYITYDNLPLPFFIKSDDIEFSIRNLKKLILLNGINVWHESFESKYSAQNEYYTVRNYLVSAAIHRAPVSKQKAIDFFMQYVKHYICNYKYVEIEHFCNAINDFLGGVDRLKSINIEAYHKSILQKGYKMVDVGLLPVKFTNERYFRDIGYNQKWSKLKKILAKYTLNGLLLPGKGYSVLGMWGGSYEQTYRKNFLVRYEINSKKGFILKRDRKKAFAMLKLYRGTKKNIEKKFDWAYNDFATRWKELVTYDNWNKQLELTKK